MRADDQNKIIEKVLKQQEKDSKIYEGAKAKYRIIRHNFFKTTKDEIGKQVKKYKSIKDNQDFLKHYLAAYNELDSCDLHNI
jgi:hypothetical protein